MAPEPQETPRTPVDAEVSARHSLGPILGCVNCRQGLLVPAREEKGSEAVTKVDRLRRRREGGDKEPDEQK